MWTCITQLLPFVQGERSKKKSLCLFGSYSIIYTASVYTGVTSVWSCYYSACQKLKHFISRWDQREMSKFYEMIVSAIVRKSLYEDVSNFEWLTRWSFWIYEHRRILSSNKNEEMLIVNLILIFSTVSMINLLQRNYNFKFAINFRKSHEKHTIFTGKLQSAFAVDGVFLEHLLWMVTSLWFPCKNFIYTLN